VELATGFLMAVGAAQLNGLFALALHCFAFKRNNEDDLKFYLII
jgi:hypothetical protein